MKKLKIGSIYEIPLPNSKKVYARLYKEYTLAIYEGKYDNYQQLKDNTKIYRYIGVYKDVLDSKDWKIVDYKPFDNLEDAWAPPKCVVDEITGEGSIYYKGEISKCTYDECKDLEVAAAWDKDHVIDMLMGITKWDESLQKPIKK